MTACARIAVVSTIVVVLAVATVTAHSGPPFPIVSDQTAGPYKVSVWTDPDSTDDGTAGGRFWVTLSAADGKSPLPPSTAVTLQLEPADRGGVPRSGSALPIDSDPARRYAALVMDHEGRFRVRVTIVGPLGSAFVDSEVDATYDLRPPAAMIVVYLLPFVLTGFLWLKLLRARRGRGHSIGTVKGDSQR